MDADSPAHGLKRQLQHAGVLLGLAAPAAQNAPRPSDLASVLRSRLAAYCAATATPTAIDSPETPTDERTLQRETGRTAHAVLERIARLVSAIEPEPVATSSSSSAPPAPRPPLFGARDTKTLGMLAGVVGRWALLEPEKPKKPAQKREMARIVELEEDELDAGQTGQDALETRGDAAMRVLKALKFIGGGEGLQTARSEQDKELVGIVLPQLLGPLVRTLAELSTVPSAASREDASTALQLVFSSIQTTTVISTLLSLLASAPPASPLRRALSAQLSTQLVRPAGVRSFLLVLVGAGTAGGAAADEVDVRKLEMIRRVVETRPETVPEETYYGNVVQQLLAILRSAAESSVTATLAASSSVKGKAPLERSPAVNVPVPIIRATCYLLAHLMIRSAVAPSSLDDVPRRLVLDALHGPFLPASHQTSPPAREPSELATRLALLSLLSLYSPPLPNFISALLPPVLCPLLSLLSHLSHPPLVISDPSPSSDALRELIKDEATALVQTAAKGLDANEAVAAFAGAVERWEMGYEFGRPSTAMDLSAQDGAEGEGDAPWRWQWTDEGLPTLRRSSANGPDLDPLGADADEDAEFDADEMMGAALSPIDIPFVVSLLRTLDLKSLSAGLLLRWLDELKTLRSDSDFVNGMSGARRAVTRLQLVLQMVEHLDAQEILRDRPKEIIGFVAHALDIDGGSTVPAPAARKEGEGVAAAATGDPIAGLTGLRLNDPEPPSRTGRRPNDAVADEGDQEEAHGLGTGLGRDEMALTALTLLLAVLEADPTLDASNTPLLAVVYSQLDALSRSTSSELIPPLAREARMVLALRKASGAFGDSQPEGEDPADPLAESRRKYREALKLLQDPLLPVRAQGLTLLRSLVLDRSTALLSTDPALLPAVLDIFVQAVEEEDSFLYLNAIQGLSSLVDVFGKQVIGRLLEVYTGARKGDREPRAVGTGEHERRELDKRLRVGETLVQVIQRAGEALAVLADGLIPPLLLVVRTSSLPIPLRASAVTILATALETSPAAFAPHAEILTEACVTLLSVETVPLGPRSRPEAVQPLATARKASAATSSRVLVEEIDEEAPDSADSDSEAEDEAGGGEAESPTGRPRKPEEMPVPTSTAPKHPTLRRAAAVFLAALVRTVTRLQLDEREKEQRRAWQSAEARLDGQGAGIRMPFDLPSTGTDFLLRRHGGGGVETGAYIGADQLIRARTVLRYVSETDQDALVRDQTAQILRELEDA